MELLKNIYIYLLNIKVIIYPYLLGVFIFGSLIINKDNLIYILNKSNKLITNKILTDIINIYNGRI